MDAAGNDQLAPIDPSGQWHVRPCAFDARDDLACLQISPERQRTQFPLLEEDLLFEMPSGCSKVIDGRDVGHGMYLPQHGADSHVWDEDAGRVAGYDDGRTTR